ncbi:N-acetylglucosaminyl-diphospho-decaprenol L-rhamnosyltransferase [Flavobacterium sp. ACN2]|jgi:GT2 family glycosyltransferase|uniref:glycosyltransferase family 2 protein n=1 Tax=Flavobacterium sp. ACN2 TaxID=1975676 RepID=UPI000BB30E2D|nr:glycosyltransferase family 2 protein [Flavobacterium sp. ACN2]PBI84133.1 N-acetylglucosaminyl-diphospho-decaprenol L-rhamnosyltransferase [Flavobacterium sp. ACN2]
MKIVVVIVTHNPKKWLHKCLSSLKNSTIDLSIIVVDNKSTDGSPAIIKNDFPEVKLIEEKENKGFGNGNNIGIKKAFNEGADYFFLLNQDAWIEPNTIANLIIAHQKEPQFGIVSPMHLNGKGDALDYKFSLYINPSSCKNIYSDIYLKKIKNSIYEVDFVNAAAWLISRNCIEKVGGFNPSFFHYGEDDNYIQRIKFHSFKLGVLPTCNIFHDRETILHKNIYFEDEIVSYKRLSVLKFSNPYNNCSFQNEYKKNYMGLAKAIVFLKIGDMKKNILKIKILNQLDKENILKNNNESKKIASSFLN